MEEQKEKNVLFEFLISKRFFKNLGLAIVLVIVLFFLLTQFLKIFTHHGNELTVPDFKDMTVHEIDSLKYAKDFDLFVIDSLYDEVNRKGSVVMQDPLPGSKVKRGRNIYVTIVASTAEMVIMPDLKDLTLRQAINILESSKLIPGMLNYKPSFDKNAVLEQFYNEDTIFAGDTLVKGSVIDLEVGTGDHQYKIPIPMLIGKTREEAIYDLNIASFNLGREFYLDSIMDEHARVYMQEPLWDIDIPFYPGDSIHLWYRSDDSVNYEAYLKTFLPDSLQEGTLENPDTLFSF